MTPIAHQPERLAKTNGIELCYDIFGSPDAPPLILIMGLGAQMIMWDDAFCEQIAERGLRVIRLDNRDIGKSTKITGGEPISFPALIEAQMLGKPIKSAYLLSDMGKDVTGLMDVLGIKSAHIVGASMGGMIAQTLALNAPERVLSLTSIMSSTGEPGLPPPTPEAAALLMAPPPATKEEYLTNFGKTWRLLRVGSFPKDEAMDRARGERSYDRGLNPAGVGRQLVAIVASGSRKEALASLKVPTLVIHGDVDPLVRVEAGQATAAAVPGSKLLIVKGMGHALPTPIWPQVIDAIVAHANAVKH